MSQFYCREDELADNFFRFWYRFVPVNMSAIDSGRIAKTYPHPIKQCLSDYMGLIFEKNHYYIFSKGGFTEGLLQAQERGEVRLITLEALYK